ncbi:cubilin-like isoform X2 [Neocloeon triangulifer]|uniref:cubilin-like isoform X2 n=1 Tax=Neocloeon triangulifer TaxID=2078957 RepID=UPI00286F47DA|nr:cubilin-like isoform X2 [Neocloeon triangulifer]
MAASKLLLLFLCFLNFKIGDAQYQRQPRLRTQNGNLIILSAIDKNITLKTSGSQSYVNINGENLIGLVSEAKSAVTALGKLQESTIDEMQKSLTFLSEEIFRDGGVSQRTGLLEGRVGNVTKNLTLTKRSVAGKFRTLTTRLKKLERNFDLMRRNLRRDECRENPCKNDGTCEDAYNAFYCRCPPGWEGPTCEVNINECARYAGTDLGCQNGATCRDKPGSYECLCGDGFSGLHCTLPSLSNCSSASAAELCGHGTCIPQRVAGRTFSCLCEQGWRKNEVTGACTEDVDECAALHRPACSVSPAVPCINTPGAFLCGACPAGYTGNGFYCSDIDECLENNGGCSDNPKVACYNTMGSRMCGPCPPGFKGDGTTCTASRPCETNNGGCHPMARCFDNPNVGAAFVQCVCPPGYQGIGFGPEGCVRAAPTLNACTPNPCAHGDCVLSNSTLFNCVCHSGYAGLFCETPIMDVCHPNPCQNGGVCAPQNGTYACRCGQNFAGPQCQFRAASCGGEINQDSGVITFSTKDEHSNAGLNCLWHVTVNESKIVSGSFSDFQISLSPSCTEDWVQIHDGPRPTSPSVGTFCKEKPPPATINTTGNSLVLWYHSPRHPPESSFTFRWSSKNPTCGGIFTGQAQGMIKSPGFPASYPINRDCVWHVRVRQGKRVRLNIFTLVLQQTSNCGDYIEIRDGNLATSRLLRKICNSSDATPVTSSGSHMFIRFRSDNDTARGAGGVFDMTFAEMNGLEGCGGIYTSERGEITSPNYPRSYSGNLYCEYLIQLPINERIKVVFSDFKIESADDCKYDSLEIREGSNENSPLVSKSCGEVPPAPFTSNGNELLFIFQTDASTTARGFKIKYETACGGVFTEASGMFSSPNYPLTYPNSRTCVYKIAQPLHKAIILEFLDFELEQHANCVHDYVEIRDGAEETSQFMGRFCGVVSKKPPVTLSTRNYLWIKFKTDLSATYKGFVANYSTVETSCGGILTNKTGDISSKTQGDVCTYVIHVQRGLVIRLNWRKVWSSISNPESNCVSSNYIQVFDNSSSGLEIGRYCGNKLPPMLTSQGNMMTIVINQTVSASNTEFDLSYNTIQQSELCGGTFYTASGMIQSPNYPRSYAIDLDCIYLIQVESGQQISLNFTTFELENSSDCSFDYVEIRNGPSGTSPLIGTYCGSTKPPVIPSHTNFLWIRFHTDNSLTAKGFRAIWDGASSGCGGILRSPSGHIESPNYPQPYGVNAECFWKIYTSKGNRITLSVVDIDIEKADDINSCYDYIEFRDGDSVNDPMLAKLCNSKVSNRQITSTSNMLWVMFRTDASEAGRGFSLRYDTECNNLLTGHRGVIESPNFPGDYPHNSNCTWVISAPPGNQVNVSFSHFALEKIGADCSVDYVQLRSGTANDNNQTEVIGKYCSSEDQPGVITSRFNTLYVDFVTDFSVALSGFRLEWVVHGCGGRFEAPYGTLQSPNYPNNYPKNTECRWEIAVDWGKSVELTITDLHMELSADCAFDYVQVFGGPDDKSPLLLQTCSTHETVQKVVSAGRYMTVYFKSDHSLGRRGFSAYFRQLQTGCGGQINGKKGRFVSTSSTSQYFPQNAVCNWLVSVDANYRVKLNFTEFHVPMVGNSCDRQYVAVWDGYNDRVPPLAKLCGDKNISAIISKSNFLLVRIVTSNETKVRGFEAEYQITCGATIETSGSGFLKSTEMQDRSDDEMELTNNCTWTIISKIPTSRVTLSLTHLDVDESYSFNNNTCLLQFLEVRDGIGLSAPLIGKYCSRKIPPHIVSNGQALTVNLVTLGGKMMPKHFTASYSVEDTACGGSLTSEEGSFATAGYPGSYKLNTECIWILGASPGNFLKLTFSMFDLELSDGCNNDYLEIRQGTTGADPLIGVYCGTNIPSDILISSKLWIKFKSDDQTVGGGFLAHYSLVHGGELVGAKGVITNPMYPKLFTTSGEFWWRVIASPSKVIRLTFKQIYLNSIGCLTSFRIYDGRDEKAPQLLEICEEQPNPSPIVSTGNVVYISFRSTTMWFGSLFMIEWVAEPRRPQINSPTITPGCGGANGLTNGSFEFTSPGYPGGYASNLRCEWIFQTASGYHVALYFNALNVEQSAGCNYDAVDVYSGSKISNDWTLIQKYCRPNATQLNGVHSTDTMKVVFRSDAGRNKTGFSATAVSVCGGNLEGSSGTLKIYNLTQTLPQGLVTTCEWNITVRAGRTIKVDISQINISNNRPGCPEEYLLFRNVVTNNSDSSYQNIFCGNLPPTGTIETIGNVLFVRFKVRKDNVENGFTLTWQESSSNCGGRYTFTEESGIKSVTIKTPNHPNPPPTNTECEWVFLAPSGRSLRVDFNEPISMVYSRGCAASYVQFFDGGSAIAASLGKFCNNKPNSILTSDNALFVRFVTTAAEPKNGFIADIRLDECGGTFTNDFNTIEVPEKNDNMPKVCVWRIVASEGNLISYSFDSFNMESSGENCSSDYVEVREALMTGTNNNSLVAQSLNHPRYCGSSMNRTWVSTGTEELILILNSTRGIGRAAKRYFKFTYKAMHQDCGGVINAPEGEIVSPGYPGSQSKRQICNWVVTVPEGRRIKIEFIDFDLAGSKSGCQQWLGIYNGHLSILPIGLYCGGENLAEVSSSSNKVLVQSLTWHTSNHRGFKLKFSSDLPTVCEGNIVQNFGSLSFPKVNMSSIFCVWNRRMPPDSPKGTFAMTIHNTTMNSTQESSCFRSSRALIIGTESLPIAQICDTITAPKIVTNPYPSTQITARQNDANNKVDFNLWYQFYECGGLLRGPMENISSPANMGMECGWSLNYQYGQINLTFAVFNFTSDCSEQSLSIYNGLTSNRPLIGRFCRENLPPASILAQSNALYVEYHGSKNVNNASHFLLSTMLVQRGCGGIFHIHTGLIASPSYPKLYPNNSECNWEIVVDEGYQVGLRFINRFYIESSSGCTKDFLEVFDFVNNGWKSLGRACGREIPKPFNSTTNRMKVLFRSDNATRGDGFVAIWSVNCGGVFTAREGYISSPSYPGNYGKMLNCKYTISAPRKAIKFDFVDFSLEQGFQDCRYDNVSIAKFSPSKGRSRITTFSTQAYCGQDAPPDGVSTNILTIRFQTDKWIEKRGFRMHYVLEDCGGDINETTVLTPNLFSVQFVNVISCTWRIFAPDKQNVLLKFEEINLRRSNKCVLSSIQLFNGTATDPKAKIATFCGNVSDDQRVFVSQGNVLTLNYIAFRTYMRTNPFSVAVSFTYGESVGCGGQITLDRSTQRTIGSYSSRGVGGAYENMLDCRWFVKSDAGQIIKMTFNSFAVKDCNRSLTNASCDCDFLEVRDGINQFSPLLGRFCGNKRPSAITSSGNRLYVRFVSDDFESDSGFQAVVAKEQSICGPPMLTVDDTVRELTLPGYDSRATYPGNVRCRWKIRGNETRRIDIHLMELDLETSTGCQNDRLVITENAEPSEFDEVVYTGLEAAQSGRIAHYMPRADANHESIYCGKGYYLDWYSRTKAVDVIFSTNNAVAGKGFKLQYQYARCSRNFTKDFGRIHYQGRTDDKFKGECSILITTEPNRTIALYFSELYSYRKNFLSNATSCNGSSTYRVYDGVSKSGDVLAEYCGVTVPNPVFSSGPALLIAANQNSFWAEEGFDATYTTSDKGRGCGGIVRNVAGSVTSPLYPGKIVAYAECVWEITVPEGSYVAIFFTAFNLGPKEICNSDYLKIFEMSSSDGQDVFRTQLCGNDMPAPFSANSNSVRLKYTSSIHNAGTGWKLNFAAKKIGG